MTRSEILFNTRLRKLVPRAYQLAIIAAVNAVTHLRTELNGYRALQFYGQVRNTPARIQLVGRDDRSAFESAARGMAKVVIRRSPTFVCRALGQAFYAYSQ